MTNLSVSIERNEGTSALITWTPPYTLANVPILSYVVMIDVGINLTMNVTDTSLEYSANPENCNNFHVAVRPVNKVGKGKIAATSTELSVIIATTGLPRGIFEKVCR